MDLLNELSKLVDDARAHRNRAPKLAEATFYGWTREQWAWAMLKHSCDSHNPFKLSALTPEEALRIQAWWKACFTTDPPKWANELFQRFRPDPNYVFPAA